MGQYYTHATIVFQTGEHVLYESEIGVTTGRNTVTQSFIRVGQRFFVDGSDFFFLTVFVGFSGAVDFDGCPPLLGFQIP